MSTFKVGDRVRTRSGRVGKVRLIVAGDTIDVVGEDFVGDYKPEDLTLAPPMSPQAKMLWHAMRAGAKRRNGNVIFSNQRKRYYSDGEGIFLTIYIDLTEMEEA